MFKFLEGDKVLWVILILLAIFSFLPVYSATSNLVYVIGKGTSWGYLIKHFLILTVGLSLVYSVHKIPYNYFKGISILLLPVVIFLLIYTITQGNIIYGANASRWIKIPVIGIGFQTSTLASLSLIMYSAHYLAKINKSELTFKSTLIPFWFPVFLIFFLIIPSNLSTALLLFVAVIIISFISGYSIKYLFYIFCIVFFLMLAFFLIVKSYPNLIPNRVDTWINRIENFKDNTNPEGNYQIERAKTAIATGDFFGLGAGKSRMKNFLPQSSSDFIYAIIVEEYGLIGGIGIIILYLLLLFRLTVISFKTETVFGKLLVLGLGLPIVIQAFMNIGVALQVFPVTGQTLPMISMGGTSVWMTCVALGIILSVSRSNQSQKSTSSIDMNSTNPINILSETF
jgi:cell division protein FtsW